MVFKFVFVFIAVAVIFVQAGPCCNRQYFCGSSHGCPSETTCVTLPISACLSCNSGCGCGGIGSCCNHGIRIGRLGSYGHHGDCGCGCGGALGCAGTYAHPAWSTACC